MNQIEGTYEGAGRRFVLVAARFNDLITTRLVEGASDCLRRHGVAPGDISVVWVPGAFEIPLAARRAAQRLGCDAVVCLGAVIKGEPTITSTWPGTPPRGWRAKPRRRGCR